MMFEIDEQKIGKYISNLIDKKYDSRRQFCRKYLKCKGAMVTDEEIQNMSNRLSQMIKGKKSIQPYDLPIFTELLEVSCEEILSAGKQCSASANRVTNYSIAHSKEVSEWEDYVERKDKLILNTDEYGKTAIDYAIEFGNLDFIKFLIDKNYIWFDGRIDKDYVFTFGAGTSIKRRNPYKIDDYLQYELANDDKLRLNIISMAVDRNDMDILDDLRAREIPEMYHKAHYIFQSPPDFYSHYDKDMIKHISAASDEMLDYFTDEFEITDGDNVKYKTGGSRSFTFMFPYISELLDLMVANNNPFLEIALKKATKHNESIYERLKFLISKSADADNHIGDRWKNEYIFYDNGNIVRYYDTMTADTIIANVVRVNKQSKNVRINYYIDELNKLFDEIKNIKE